MNLDALPYTSFIVLVEFSVGSLVFCVFADWRGRVAASFVKFSAAMVGRRRDRRRAQLARARPEVRDRRLSSR